MPQQGMNGLDDSVHKYLEMLQLNIQRMSKLSLQCKVWCVALFSAVFLYYFKENNNDSALKILFLPVLLFWYTDALYLGVERDFIALFNHIQKKMASTEIDIEWSDLFVFKTTRGWRRYWNGLKISLGSFATLLFYGAITLTLSYVLWGKCITSYIFSK